MRTSSKGGRGRRPPFRQGEASAVTTRGEASSIGHKDGGSCSDDRCTAAVASDRELLASLPPEQLESALAELGMPPPHAQALRRHLASRALNKRQRRDAWPNGRWSPDIHPAKDEDGEDGEDVRMARTARTGGRRRSLLGKLRTARLQGEGGRRRRRSGGNGD